MVSASSIEEALQLECNAQALIADYRALQARQKLERAAAVQARRLALRSTVPCASSGVYALELDSYLQAVRESDRPVAA